ncbi:MAG: NUDIX hydrolase [Corynebacteriales bacterium]|nr:NUDIX hydrolase [Mycobacteriales bacterium]
MIEDRFRERPSVLLTVDLVILTLREAKLHVLMIERGNSPYKGMFALPGGFLQHREEDIFVAARRELSEETGLEPNFHLEQFGVYGAPGRDTRGRVVSVAHLAIVPRLPEPAAGTDAANAIWLPIDRLLRGEIELAFDHQQIITDGLERARAKLEYSSLATAFCEETFTISELQRVYEAVWGVQLDPRNFYRKVKSVNDFIVEVGATKQTENGRPARLFRPGTEQVLYPPMVRPPRFAEGEER